MGKELEKKEIHLPIKYFTFTPTSLEIAENTPYEAWLDSFNFLKSAEKAVQFWIGDWLNFGERKWGDKYTEALDNFDYSYGTLRNIAWVSKNISLSCRHDKLSFEHHVLVAKLEEKEQEKWLKKAEEENWSYKELKTAIKRDKISTNKLIYNIKIDFELGDFKKLIKKIPNNSVDLIITDPPYAKKYLDLWEPLGKEANRILKASGFLITYSGNYYLPQVIESLKKYLNYYYLFTLYHKGNTSPVFDLNLWDRTKPILIFQKFPKKKQNEWLENCLMSELPNKEMHEWGQSIEPFVKLIEHFSKINDTICDPFVGGGTTIEACVKTNRNFIGYEIDKETYDLVKKRL